jgi:hypothetical protein
MHSTHLQQQKLIEHKEKAENMKIFHITVKAGVVLGLGLGPWSWALGLGLQPWALVLDLGLGLEVFSAAAAGVLLGPSCRCSIPVEAGEAAQRS